MLKDLTARKFSALLVLRPSSVGHDFYLCRCDCGNELIVGRKFLMTDHYHSCGCKFQDNICKSKYYPGTRKLYQIWQLLMARVERRRDIYTGEFIHPDWMEYSNFAAWAVSQAYVDGQVLAPVPKGKSYSPLNCRWVWKRGKHRDKRDRLPPLTLVNGVHLDLRQLADDCGVPYTTLYMRLRNGWSLLDAITEPVRKRTSVPCRSSML